MHLALVLCLELALIQEEEVRRYTGEKRWRRNGWETVERRLIQVLDTQTLSGPEAFARLLLAMAGLLMLSTSITLHDCRIQIA